MGPCLLIKQHVTNYLMNVHATSNSAQIILYINFDQKNNPQTFS
jgi:hypothetical protein